MPLDRLDPTGDPAAAVLERAVRRGHFVLDSGAHASRFFQAVDLLRGDPDELDRLLGALAAPWLATAVDAVLGANPAGGVLAYETARRLGAMPLFAVRRAGTYRLVGSPPPVGHRVLVVDDVTTTGGTARHLLQAVVAAGGQPVGLALLATKGLVELDLGVPIRIVAALGDMDAVDPAHCPQCAERVPVAP
jgi:orotate phosphoribosyltransferase